jgi:L-iditol 2-dehydrogenase
MKFKFAEETIRDNQDGMSMKALQLVYPRYFAPVEVPMPVLKSSEPDRILVQTRRVSLCGSDIPFFTGSKRHKSYPLAPGAPIHECLGRVVESTSSDFKAGDSVIAIPEGDLGLAEYFTARSAKAVCMPTELAELDSACLIQPLSTVVNAVDRLGDVSGKTVAVIGLGSIGLFFCWLLKKAGAAAVTGIDPLPERCRAAEAMGAAKTYPARSIEVVQAARQDPAVWQPPQICIEAVGHQTETINDCFELVQKRGTILAFGVPDQLVYAVEYETFFRKNAALLAVVTPEWSEYLPRARQLFLNHRDELERLVTHRLPIQEAERAFSLYANHSEGVLKVILEASTWNSQI